MIKVPSHVFSAPCFIGRPSLGCVMRSRSTMIARGAGILLETRGARVGDCIRLTRLGRDVSEDQNRQRDKDVTHKSAAAIEEIGRGRVGKEGRSRGSPYH